MLLNLNYILKFIEVIENNYENIIEMKIMYQIIFLKKLNELQKIII